ncbi:MAG TPA: 3'-5' exonuclease [Azospirillum sp.]|nr:3'-5' exonuclease [Azospirillum sp.]
MSVASFAKDRLLCLDVESVTDPELLSAEEQDEKFPAAQRHQVMAISFLEARIDHGPGGERYIVEQCRSGGDASDGEERLLKGFWKFFGAGVPRLVTWNGKGFVMPVLRQRAMVYGIPAAPWFQAGDKWNNYGQRYSPDWHCDLMEVLSDYGASTRVGLQDMAEAIGLPGKIEGQGSDVADMVMRGDIAAVRRYGETDVLNIFGLYVRWALLSGRTDPEGHNASIESLVTYLERGRADRPYLGAFLDHWRVSTRPAPMFVPVPKRLPSAEELPASRTAQVPDQLALPMEPGSRSPDDTGLRAAARDLARQSSDTEAEPEEDRSLPLSEREDEATPSPDEVRQEAGTGSDSEKIRRRRR